MDKKEKTILCPHCNADLNGSDTMYREIKVEDTDWLGIIDGEIVDCNLSLKQPSFGDIICLRCKESIEDYIRELIDNEQIGQGELSC